MNADVTETIRATAYRALQGGAYDDAIRGFEAVIAENPADSNALAGIGQAYRYFNRNDRVVELYRNAVASDGNNPALQAGYVEALIAESLLDQAREVAKSAIAAHPEVLQLRLLYAQTDLALGNQHQARTTFWECLARDPDNVDSAHQLAQIAPPEDMPRLLKALSAMWAHREDRDAWDAATLGYAYGKAGEREKDYDKAWEGFSFGAGKRRSIVRFDEPTIARTHDLHRNTFSAAIPPVDANEQPGAQFVFIVSLPRSGSTLVEQILNAHPQVEAIGERSIVYDAVTYWHQEFGPDPQRLFSPDALRSARARYVDAARALVTQSDCLVVDKSITNYLFLGFLRAILPGAHFVHVARNPLDTAISCFTTTFFAGNEWTYELREIGRNIRRYQKLMRYWMSQWPDDILTVRYEALVEDPETISRSIVSFCDLPWDPACLDFHESDRAILTASLNQVRQPIYQTAKGRAANYETHLGPLIAAMGRRAADPDWCLPKGSAR